ncbi:hypothetical protein GPA19_07695 [Azoarcus indigens]|uniref:Cyd operon protein YbgE n=1 Tax=Azoarcus indigens TaxID=29545 RepID=A0A4R6DZG6_9RHOO|nr:cyd operon YbgE family protein [Azoarcus indigens]NMG64829.1 hypothetical protein [Azoarcus indigens]TDN50786.1 cyd operon protein YbgE [Azoarcus indigens]
MAAAPGPAAAGSAPIAATPGRLRPLPLLAALALMLGLGIAPNLFATADGRADHLAALALCWAMSAGFVAGVGFRPQALAWRLLFSPAAVALGLALGLGRLLMVGG